MLVRLIIRIVVLCYLLTVECGLDFLLVMFVLKESLVAGSLDSISYK